MITAARVGRNETPAAPAPRFTGRARRRSIVSWTCHQNHPPTETCRPTCPDRTLHRSRRPAPAGARRRAVARAGTRRRALARADPRARREAAHLRRRSAVRREGADRGPRPHPPVHVRQPRRPARAAGRRVGRGRRHLGQQDRGDRRRGRGLCRRPVDGRRRVPVGQVRGAGPAGGDQRRRRGDRRHPRHRDGTRSSCSSNTRACRTTTPAWSPTRSRAATARG